MPPRVPEDQRRYIARLGRPRVSGEEDALIIAAAVADPFLNAKEIKQELGLHMSSDTVRRRLKEAGLQNCAAAQKPFLTDNQRRQRLEFARAYKGWGVDEWSQVIFTDESTFCTRWDQQQRVWRPLNCSRRLPNADALWSAIQEAWEALSREPETSRALYASMPRRIAEVIAAEGHYTGH
ncbi:hypothetical protein HPB50_026618 [Hyalomma asiaticum]|uniref:Uncharacterized protein n=1 Tax=Hyalomma asiaticum TaxID=266040 RepID=A0ACB7TR90_HYAAI|nr:hypothetical protein HPB50_026618 [Hyalomma asiaticum]